jgi:hypothetical protein
VRSLDIASGFFYLKVYGNLKTVTTMNKARVEFNLLGTQEGRNRHYLRCYPNIGGEISILICEDNCPDIGISLDIPTAIKLSKILRQSINELKGGQDV